MRRRSNGRHARVISRVAISGSAFSFQCFLKEHMRRPIFYLTLIAVAAVVSGCIRSSSESPEPLRGKQFNLDSSVTTEESNDPGSRLSGKLVLTGSSTIAPLVSEMAKRFEELYPDVRIEVQTGGSSRGISDTRSGTADIGMISRNLKDTERDLIAHELARDGVCLIVHADNPVSNLSDEQVVSIYTDKVANWNEVGGPDAPIVAVHKTEGRGTLEVFLGHFNQTNQNIKADIIAGDNQQAIKSVAGNPYAVGYVSIGAADAEAKLGTPIRLLPAGTVAATAENVANGSFPIVRSLSLVTKGAPAPLATAFLQFACSADVSDLIEAQYFVPLSR